MSTRPILLVEDNPDDVELTRIAFAEANIANALTVVTDGAAALDYLFARGAHAGRDPDDLPSIVLLDLNLPKVDGREVLQAIRSHERTRSLPVVVMTTSAEPFDVEASYALGANSYIRKPVDFGQFVWAVKQVGLYWLVLNHGREPH
ncbi:MULTISPECIES: response regulator [unclassified Luteimonas]|uniref:response regulator n=1 Tax=unclassified Luteimonas TaxID=2629088 RepID=UPI0018F0E29D|nr:MULTISPECIES: response regulator [unclassified Luteimonas]MBJ6981942.1 response regulator [Luteimonas sp. MC1572]MBJ7575504.1 response regulator [Luteimonas sp. MC1828]QQO03217.1 response regulator [Luteimonas sp. MC1572]